MKKLLLLLFLGIFLISFASATINVYANSTRPVFYAELLESNGTDELNSSTNYYFQCFVGGYQYTGETGSSASEEFNVTTNSTHRWINISNIKSMCDSYGIISAYKGVLCRYSINRSFKDWGGEGYMPASFSSNTTLTTQYWLAQYGNAGVYFLSGLRCSNNIYNVTVKASDIMSTSAVIGTYIHHPEISVPKAYRDNLTAGGFNVTRGGLWIDINATGNQTWDDLINALNDNSDAEGLYSNTMYGGLTFIGTTTGTGKLNITGKTVNQILGLNMNYNLIFEQGSQYYVETNGYISAVGQGGFYDSSFTLNPVNAFVLNNVYGNNIFLVSLITGHTATNYSGWVFNGLTSTSTSPYHTSTYFTDGNTASNSVWNNIYDYVVPHTTQPLGIPKQTTSYFINNTFNNYGVVTYSNGRSVDIVAYNGYLYTTPCVNISRDYELINTVSNRPDKRLVITYNSHPTSAQWCNTSLNFTAKGDMYVKIIQTNGTEIENVNVTLSNEYNIYTGLTGINGVTILTPAFYRVYYDYYQLSDPNRYASYLEMGLYNLSITKDGFRDYEAIINISEPVVWTIALTAQDVPSPASLVLDKIISLNQIENETISYNITLRLTNKGESNSTNTNITDSDSENSPYNLGNISNNNFTTVSYLKNFSRNSTTYTSLLSVAQANAIDSSTSSQINANSSSINLIIPSTSTGPQLTLIKNAYYNSENSTHVNYTLTIEVVNSGGEDLTSINLLDTDLDLNEIINLNRTQSYNYSNFTIIEKAASNTNKLFSKSSATQDTVVYQSNQIQVRIPGYGGPADAIVYSPSSVTSSVDFDSTITVKNMNPDIGQDFTIDYWITNELETINYSSGQQTIYVPYSGESNFTATLTSPSLDGNYKLKTLVTWVGGTASAYDSFSVNTPPAQTPEYSHSSGGSVITTKAITSEVICNVPYIRYGLECCLDKNNNTICDKDEEDEIQNETSPGINTTQEEFSEKETNRTSLRQFLNKSLESIKIKSSNLIEKIFKQKDNKNRTYLWITGVFLILLILLIILLKNIKGKRNAKRDFTRLSKVKRLNVYDHEGSNIGKVKEIYINIEKNRIYGLLIRLNKSKRDVLIKYNGIFSVKEIIILKGKLSEDLN